MAGYLVFRNGLPIFKDGLWLISPTGAAPACCCGGPPPPLCCQPQYVYDDCAGSPDANLPPVACCSCGSKWTVRFAASITRSGQESLPPINGFPQSASQTRTITLSESITFECGIDGITRATINYLIYTDETNGTRTTPDGSTVSYSGNLNRIINRPTPDIGPNAYPCPMTGALAVDEATRRSVGFVTSDGTQVDGIDLGWAGPIVPDGTQPPPPSSSCSQSVIWNKSCSDNPFSPSGHANFSFEQEDGCTFGRYSQTQAGQWQNCFNGSPTPGSGTWTQTVDASCELSSVDVPCDNDPCQGFTPPSTGACCAGFQTFGGFVNCIVTTKPTCDRHGGVWNHGADCSRANCPPTGACCLASGGCVPATQAQCLMSLGGHYAGDNVDCQTANCNGQDGGCCTFNPGTGGYDCSIQTQAGCTARGGTFLGIGTNCNGPDPCAPRGACCLTDTFAVRSCYDNQTRLQCDSLFAALPSGGTFQPTENFSQGSTCQDIGCGPPGLLGFV